MMHGVVMFCTLRARMWVVGSGGVFSCVLECIGVCVTCCALSCGVRGLCCRGGASWAAHSPHDALVLQFVFEHVFVFVCGTVFFDSPSAQCDRSSWCGQVLMCTYFYLVRPWPEPVHQCASSRAALRSWWQGKIGKQKWMRLSG